jgi:hypothetical protein
MSYLSELRTTEAPASSATNNLLALLFVAVASATPVHALPVTWLHDDATHVSKPVIFIFDGDRMTLDIRAVAPPEAKCSKERIGSTCFPQMGPTFTVNERKSAFRWSSERAAVIVPQAMEPQLGNVELHFLTADGRNIKAIQKTRRGAEAPDALSITVPHPFDDDENTGLYCYISEEDYGFIQMYFIDGTNGKRVTLSSEADILFRVFFDEVKRFTGENEITAANIGFGILREVPTSLSKALDAILNASGGCNYQTVFHLQVSPSGAVRDLHRRTE